jgi:hypothetical protein
MIDREEKHPFRKGLRQQQSSKRISMKQRKRLDHKDMLCDNVHLGLTMRDQNLS